MKSTVVIFAYHFPPDTEIGAARPYRFYTYLTQLGYDCRIITSVSQGDTPPPGVIYVPDPFVTSKHRGFRWQAERAIRYSTLPGAVGLGWSFDAVRAAREILRKERPSRVTVISTFPPMGVHFAAWQLARKENLPWIADFRDPLDPFGTMMPDKNNAFHKRICRWLERQFILAADAVIANTDVNQQTWQRRYPDSPGKFHLIWNGFDPERKLVAKPLPNRDYKVLCHTGTLYMGRSIGPIVDSINRLIEKRMIPPGTLHLRHIGAAEPLSTLGPKDLVARAQAQGWLELSDGIIPQAEARDLMQTSDYLLLVQQQSKTQVPGKLYEYLQIGRPILAFITPDSPCERILAKSGIPYRCLYPEDSPQRMDQVMTEFLNLPADPTPASAWFEENFNGKTQTRTLAAIIDTMKQSETGR